MASLLKIKQTSTLITMVCAAGVLLSLYALHVETKKERDHSYEAMCDISEQMSCTNVLSSRWGRGFGIVGLILGEDSVFNQPNSIAGIFFYSLCLLLNRTSGRESAHRLFLLSIASNFMSIYLASILYFVLHDFCVVCVSTYVVNALLFVLARKKKNLYAKDD